MNKSRAGFKSLSSTAALLFVSLLTGNTACAEPKSQDAAMQQVLRKAQGVVRQLTQEKAALETEKTALLNDKTGLEGKVKDLEEALRKLQPLQGEVERLTAAKGSLEALANQSREQQQILLRKHKEVIAKAHEIRADNELLVQAVQEREQWIGQCGERNKGLREANQEIVDKYQDKSFWDELTEIEPFTGIGKVKTESVAEEYRYKLENLKITPFQTETQAPNAVTPPGTSTKASDDVEDE